MHFVLLALVCGALPLVLAVFRAKYRATALFLYEVHSCIKAKLSNSQLLDRLNLFDFDQAGFPCEDPSFKSIGFTRPILEKTNAHYRMRHFCDDSSLCLNFCASYGKVVRTVIHAYKSPLFVLMHGVQGRTPDARMDSFVATCDRILVKFERYWLRRDVMNNLEFYREFELWWRRRFYFVLVWSGK